MGKTVGVYVLNYNGEQLLLECLPSIVRAVERSTNSATLYVIDNDSQDGSVALLHKQFPKVQVIRSANNFFSSYNDAIRQCQDDIVILLNNDVKVDINFIDPLVGSFTLHEDAFMTSPHCLRFDERTYEGGHSVLVKRLGWWGTKSVLPPTSEAPIYTVSMGACLAFRRDRYLELHGYDCLYNPGIVEDLDLCYRGWKAGWKAYNISESVCFHKGQSSFKKSFGVNRMKMLANRNTFLFIWKNVTDRQLLIEHFACIPIRIFYALAKGNFEFIIGFFQACAKISMALKRRRQVRHQFCVSDNALLHLLKGID